ncbi:hypothetical protein BH11ACT6_BH11ACT6_53420 [soil metagenome]
MASLRDSRARDEQAASFRGCGYSWQAIADHLGYRSRQAAQIAVARHYDRNRDSPTLSRRSLSEGLRLVKTTLFETLADAKQRGDVAAVSSMSREILRVSKELASLDGLHAPQQVDVQVTHHRSSVEVIAELQAELLASINRGQVVDAEIVDVREIEQ